MAKAGCKPYWHRFVMEDIPFCESSSTLQQYNDIMSSVSWMYRNEFLQKTKCLIPCSFIEYKVSVC